MSRKITFDCSPGIADRLNILCEKADISRSKLVLQMIKSMVTFLEETQRVGIIHLPMLIKSARSYLTSKK